MTSDIKPPRPSQDSKPQTRPGQRPSHQRVMENLDKWANSPGLQPPK
jgi:hypothetical protein